MSETYSDIYDDDSTEVETPATTGPKALREAYEHEKEARKALEDRLAAIEAESRAAKLASALKESGVTNPKVAALIPADVTPDKVADWLTEFGDVFGVEQAQPQGGVDQQTQQQIAAVSGSPTGTSPVTSGDALQSVLSASSEAEFWAGINANS